MKNFSSFMGNELALFTTHVKDTIEYLQQSFPPIPMLSNIQDVLVL